MGTKSWQATVMTPGQQTKALDTAPFADLRSQVTRDILCEAQAEITAHKIVEQVLADVYECISGGGSIFRDDRFCYVNIKELDAVKEKWIPGEENLAGKVLG